MADHGWHYDPGRLYPFSEEEGLSTLSYLDRVIVTDWDPIPQPLPVALADLHPGGNHGKVSMNVFLAQCLTREHLESVSGLIPHEYEHGLGYHYFPEVRQPHQCGYTAFPPPDTFSTGGVIAEAPALVHIHRDGEHSLGTPSHHWGDLWTSSSTHTFHRASAQTEPFFCSFIDTFPRQNVENDYTPRAQATEHRIAGPSTLVPHLALSQPTGGFTPETSANAETNQTPTEVDEAQVSDFYHSHLPRVAECLIRRQEPRPATDRPWRLLARADLNKILELVREWEAPTRVSSRNCALACKHSYLETT